MAKDGTDLSSTSESSKVDIMSETQHTHDFSEPPVLYAGGANITWPSSSEAMQPSGQCAYMSSEDEEGRIFARPPQQPQQQKKRPKRHRQEPGINWSRVPSLYQLLIVVASAQAATALVQASSTTLNLKTDDIAPEGMLLCPFKLVRQYPYKYVGTMNRQKVQDFFMNCIFEGEDWDMWVASFACRCRDCTYTCVLRFYIRDPSSSRAPLLLVPTTEFEKFLQYVNRELRVLLTIPTGNNPENFSLRFSGCPRPQFAGKVGSKDAYDALKSKLVQSNPSSFNLHPAAMNSFKDEMNKIYESVKTPKVKKDPAVQRARIMAKQKSFGQTTKRVQRYLGLRTRTAYSVGQGKRIPSPQNHFQGLTVVSNR